jgi:hypothetical protein
MAHGWNFLNRQAHSIAILKIQEDFRSIADAHNGKFYTSFLIVYPLMGAIGGG